MKFKSIIAVVFIAGVLTGCSSPQRITLKDNTVIEARDEVKYNKRTGFYEYEDIRGKKNQINSDSILMIEEM